MPRHALLAAVAATAVVLVPRNSAAQEPVGAQSFCLPGGAGRCFAFAINDNATGFDVWLRNLSPIGDGSPRDLATVAASSVRDFGFRRVNAPTTDGLRTDFRFAAPWQFSTTGAALRGTQNFGSNTGIDDFRPSRAYTFTSTFNLGLLGCVLPSELELRAGGFVAVTCAERGYDGWFRASFFGPEIVAADANLQPVSRVRATSADIAMQVAGCITHVGARSGVGEYPGARACEASPFPSTVIPEPSTVWLLATGAAALGGIASVRRRTRA